MAAQKAGLWYKGVLDGAERFMAAWHTEAEARTCARHEKEAAKSTRSGKGGRRGDSSNTAAGESKQEMADRVARFQHD